MNVNYFSYKSYGNFLRKLLLGLSLIVLPISGVCAAVDRNQASAQTVIPADLQKSFNEILAKKKEIFKQTTAPVRAAVSRVPTRPAVRPVPRQPISNAAPIPANIRSLFEGILAQNRATAKQSVESNVETKAAVALSAPPAASPLESAPTIDQIAPNQAVAGATITITGSGFGVYPADNTYNPEADGNKDGIVNQVDLGLLAVSWQCKAGQGCYNPAADFNKDQMIDVRDLVVLANSWLQSRPNQYVLFANGVWPKIISWTDTQIQCVVPWDAQSGDVVVVTPAGQSANTVFVTIIFPPLITNVTPNSSLPGATLNISGSHFGEYPADNTYNPEADGNKDGVVDKVDLGLLAVSWQCQAGQGCYNPAADFNKDQMTDVRDLVLLANSWLQSRPEYYVLFANGVWPKIISWTDTQIQCVVPLDAQSGNVVVKTPGGTSNGVNVVISEGGGPTIISSSINVNTTWDLNGSPYIITGNLHITNGATLTIKPGVKVKFNSGASVFIGNGLTDQGALDARGTIAQPIIFTSNAASPVPGGWSQIVLSESATNASKTVIKNVIVEYAGQNNADAVLVGAPITIENSIFRNNKFCGMVTNGGATIVRNNVFLNNEDCGVKAGGMAVITNNRMEANGQYGARVMSGNLLGSSPQLRNNDYVGNGQTGIAITNQDINYSTTLTKDTVPYVAPYYMYVYSPGVSFPTAVLTIEPGVTLKFKSGSLLYVGAGGVNSGALKAQGTVAEPIIFTSNAATPAAGDWQQIVFYANGTDANQTVMQHVIVEYAGQNNEDAVLVGSAITIENSIFRNNKFCGMVTNGGATIVRNNVFLNNEDCGVKAGGMAVITNNRMEANGQYGARVISGNSTTSSPELRNNDYVNNGNQGIAITNQDIQYSTTLTKDTAPYVVPYYLYVFANNGFPTAVLTIEPGVTLKFNSGGLLYVGAGVVNSGALKAEGTAAEPIVFTSNAASPAPGDWLQIYFAFGADATQTVVKNIIVEYAGQFPASALQVEASLLISNALVRNNQNSGLGSNVGNVIVTKSKFINNGAYGISVTSLNMNANLNEFINNVSGGINTTLGGNIKALANWWANASGPSGSGPGTGQAVNGSVVFDPWLGEPFNPNLFFSDIDVSPNKFNQNGNSVNFHCQLNQAVNWQITVRNSTGNIAKTFSGSGPNIHQNWSGDDNTGQPVVNGQYTFTVSAESLSSPGTIATLIGWLTLDDSIPLAKITAPDIHATVAGQIQIIGTAAGANFSSYTLEYGIGEIPGSWTAIHSGSSPVNDGLLATWTIPDLSQTTVSLRLIVTDIAGRTANDTVTVNIISIYNLTASVNAFSPNGDGTRDSTTISAQFTHPAQYTLTIKDASQVIRKTFTGSGLGLNQNWDGTDTNGVVLPDGQYSYQVQMLEPVSGLSDQSDIKTVTIDNSMPVAVISSPTENQTVSGDFPIIGTANDSNFQSYSVEFGKGTSPTFWTPIQFISSTPVINDLLGTWQTKFLENGVYTVRLVVQDTIGNNNIILRTVNVDNIQISNVSASPKFINPALNETATLSFTLDRAANVTIDLYRMGVNISLGAFGTFYKEYVSTIVTNQAMPAGLNTFIFNGRDNGNVLDSMAYGYVIKAQAADKFGIYDPPYVSGTVSVTNQSATPVNFNPFSNEPVQINYTLTAPGWVTIGGENPAIFPAFPISGAPRPAGPNTETWDGRNGVGDIVNGYTYTLGIKVEVFPDVVTVLRDNTLQITELYTDPYLILPTYNEITTVHYTINRAADVTLRMIDPNGDSWTLTHVNNQAGGNYIYQWKGGGPLGDKVSRNGNYRLEVIAEDPNTNTTVTRSANIGVYR